MSNTILVLDDDHRILEFVRDYLQHRNYSVSTFDNIGDASEFLETNSIAFAIIDLYLLGGLGAELSNQFIEEQLFPRKFEHFIRLTSAPSEVTKRYEGRAVLDKRKFIADPSLLIDQIIESFAEQGIG